MGLEAVDPILHERRHVNHVEVMKVRLDAGDAGDAVLKLERREELAPAAATKVRVDALVPDAPGKPPRLVSVDVELPITGKAVEVGWNGSGWSR